MEGLTDEQLVVCWQAARGVPDANSYLDELFRRHRRRVALWCLRFAGDRETAADWAQDVFMTAYRNLDSFRADAKFSTWLYALARNQCLNAVRARAARPEETDCVLEAVADSGRADPYEQLETETSAALLRQWIQESLDETEYRVMMLHYGQEVPLDAITRLLGLSNASGAKAYVVSARRKLRQAAERWKARWHRGVSHARA